MQRKNFCAGALATLLGVAASGAPQDTTAAAEREDLEANYKRMTVKVEQLEEAFRAQQKTFAELAGEISSLRSEVDRLKNKNESAATQESIKRLMEKIEEVDRKRMSDGEKTAKTLNNFAKELQKTPIAPAPKEPKDSSPPRQEKPPGKEAPASPPEGKSYAYKIKAGDTLDRIVTELRAQNWKVTQKQVMEANPGVNWSRLRIGQTVYIPSPNP